MLPRLGRRDQPVGVLGTPPGSVLHAHLVQQWSDDVVFCARTRGLAINERTELDALSDRPHLGRGVWVAGKDVVDPRAQVINSAGRGSAAATAINADTSRTTSPPRRAVSTSTRSQVSRGAPAASRRLVVR